MNPSVAIWSILTKCITAIFVPIADKGHKILRKRLIRDISVNIWKPPYSDKSDETEKRGRPPEVGTQQNEEDRIRRQIQRGSLDESHRNKWLSWCLIIRTLTLRGRSHRWNRRVRSQLWHQHRHEAADEYGHRWRSCRFRWARRRQAEFAHVQWWEFRQQ